MRMFSAHEICSKVLENLNNNKKITITLFQATFQINVFSICPKILILKFDQGSTRPPRAVGNPLAETEKAYSTKGVASL